MTARLSSVGEGAIPSQSVHTTGFPMSGSVSMRFYLTAALLCGCVTIEVVPEHRLSGQQFGTDTVAIAHIRADNWGWYLFKGIPVIAGNVKHPNYPSFFSHTVKLEPLVEEVTRRGKELGATITELQSTDKSGWRPLTLIFWIREVEVSANLSRQNADP